MGSADDVWIWKHKKPRDLMVTNNVTLAPHKLWSILLCPFLFCPRLALLFCQSAHICNVTQPCEQLSRPDLWIIQIWFWGCKVTSLCAAQKFNLEIQYQSPICKIKILWCRRWHVSDHTAHAEYKPETLALQLQWLVGILLPS